MIAQFPVAVLGKRPLRAALVHSAKESRVFPHSTDDPDQIDRLTRKRKGLRRLSASAQQNDDVPQEMELASRKVFTKEYILGYLYLGLPRLRWQVLFLTAREKRRFLQRSRVDIIACILRNSNDTSRKTRLIYKCNLSLSQFNMYADCLIEGGLLERYATEGGAEIYETSARGKSFLKDYGRIKKVLDKMRL